MTNEEKEVHPSYKTTGGYLKELDESDCAQMWWNGLLEYQRNIIKALPNFDAKIFKQCKIGRASCRERVSSPV